MYVYVCLSVCVSRRLRSYARQLNEDNSSGSNNTALYLLTILGRLLVLGLLLMMMMMMMMYDVTPSLADHLYTVSRKKCLLFVLYIVCRKIVAGCFYNYKVQYEHYKTRFGRMVGCV